MKAIILIITFSLLSASLLAQSYYGRTWKMGLYGGDFRFNTNNTIDEDTTLIPIFITKGFGGASSNICDSNGDIRYASSGYKIYKNDGSIIEGGDSLCPPLFMNQNNGLPNYSQMGIFIPAGAGKTYYVNNVMSDSLFDSIFNGSIPGNACFDILQYSLIDDTAYNGKGKVIRRAVPLINGNGKELGRTEMSVCRHANGKDWWLLKMAGDSSKVYRFLFTQDSVYDKGSQTLPFAFRGYGNDVYGRMVFSEDGTQWISTNTSSGAGVFMADFDRCHGTLSNFEKIIPPPHTEPQEGLIDSFNMSCAISPNKRFIYVSRYSHLMQYDRQDNTYTVIAEHDTTLAEFSGYVNMALAPNGKIYIGTFHGYSKQMSVIDNPDGKGASCNFCRKCLRSAAQFGVFYSPPNMPNYALGATSAPCYPLGVNEVLKEEDILSIYPNPASTIIHIKSKNTQSTKQMYNMVGELILSTKENEINVSHLPNGMYFLKCEGLMRKVVIE